MSSYTPAIPSSTAAVIYIGFTDNIYRVQGYTDSIYRVYNFMARTMYDFTARNIYVPAAFHAGEDVHERPLHVVVHPRHSFLHKALTVLG